MGLNEKVEKKGYKEIIENNLIVIILFVFGAGLYIGWFTSNELKVKPRDYEITQLKKGKVTNKDDSSVYKDNLDSSSSDSKDKTDDKNNKLKPISIQIIPNISLENYEKEIQPHSLKSRHGP